MTTRYKILISPTQAYHIGDSRYRMAKGKNDAGYYTPSKRFPAQTSLMGLLRYMILKDANDVMHWDDANQFRIKNEPEAKRLIGAQGFTIGLNKYGIIKQLSALTLSKSNQLYRPYPKYKGKQIEFQSHDDRILMDNYKEKIGINIEYQNINKPEVFELASSAFKHSFRKKRIYKPRKNEVKAGTDQFYEKEYQMLDRLFQFTAEITLSEDALQTGTRMENIGGDNSLWTINITKLEEELIAELPKLKLNKIYCCHTECLVPEDLKHHVKMIYASTAYLKFYSNPVGTIHAHGKVPSLIDKKHANGESEESGNKVRLQAYQVLKPGSLLALNGDIAPKIISNNADWQSLRMIGYNQLFEYSNKEQS